jgi:hypothetical protein
MKPKHFSIWTLLTITLLTGLNGCGSNEATKRIALAGACKEAKLGDDGGSVRGEYWDFDLSGLMCILDATQMPEWAKDDLGQTRPMDGRKSAEWEGLMASWSYDGKKMQITVRKK